MFLAIVNGIFSTDPLKFLRWTPLTSITTPPPSLIDTLTSCRIDPNPLFTFFVLLKILPKDNAIFLISVESTSKGSVAILKANAAKFLGKWDGTSSNYFGTLLWIFAHSV